MAHEGIFATKAEIDVKVGENVDLTGYTEVNINAACLQTESFINVLCRHNFSTAFAGLDSSVKGLLSEASAIMVAQMFITYNMAGYTSRVEAENMLNMLDDKLTKTLSLLMDQKSVTFMNGA